MQHILTSAWAKFVETTHSIPLINYGFGQNEGIWIHIIGAAILAKLFSKKLSYAGTIAAIFLVAVLWEAVEIYIETPNMAAVVSIYGTYARYLYDTAGDIIGAVLISAIANFPVRRSVKE